jgi:NAD(P)-dependent dehydrogenase (short-subunit alcohol dehydrogenase family)
MRADDLPTTPSFRLDGRRALVTGAGRGIGLGVATAFAEAGAHVTLCARSTGEIESAADALRGRGWSADALTCDVTDIDAFAETVAGAEPYDILFNNAGMNRPKPFIDVPVADYDAIMGLNVRAAYFAAQAVVRKLVAVGKPGSIINMSSQMGHVGGPTRSLYCASKWAVEGFSRAMAIELGPHGIRVNTLCPTFIETPMTRPYLENEAFRQSVVAKIKLGRVGTVSDLMGAAVFLASDASALMTGASLLVDGGWTAE